MSKEQVMRSRRYLHMGLSTIHVFRLDQVKERSGSVVEQDFESTTEGIRRLLPVFGRIQLLTINQKLGGIKSCLCSYMLWVNIVIKRLLNFNVIGFLTVEQ